MTICLLVCNILLKLDRSIVLLFCAPGPTCAEFGLVCCQSTHLQSLPCPCAHKFDNPYTQSHSTVGPGVQDMANFVSTEDSPTERQILQEARG